MDILKLCKYQELTFIFHHAKDFILEFLASAGMSKLQYPPESSYYQTDFLYAQPMLS